MKKHLFVPFAIFFLVIALLSGVKAMAGTYTTNFPLTENPISEGGKWVNGQSAGNNLWGNCQTSGNMAYGVSEPRDFGDPTAILTGTWGPNQTVQATVHITGTPATTCCNEVEVRLRSTINPSNNTISGYEVYCSVESAHPYCAIARWNGASGSYCNIQSSAPSIYLIEGDILKATVSGTNPVTITGYAIRGGSTIATWTATDTGQNCTPGGAGGPFTTGNPGFGFYDDQDSHWNYFGFSSFTASDGLVTSAPSPPTNLQVK